MLRLRPYKPCDAAVLVSWVKNESVFRKWSGDRFGAYPLTPATLDEKYSRHNGDCTEPDNFYPWTAVDHQNRPVGHFIMRYTSGNPHHLRFGWVIVDDALRGQGYGAQMLRLGLQYAFDFLQAEKVTIGVYASNESAHRCYRKVGFADVEVCKGEPWDVVEMAITKEGYERQKRVGNE